MTELSKQKDELIEIQINKLHKSKDLGMLYKQYLKTVKLIMKLKRVKLKGVRYLVLGRKLEDTYNSMLSKLSKE